MRLLLLLFFPLIPACWAQQPAVETLRQYLAIIAQEPDGARREEALRKIWSIANAAKKQEEALRLRPEQWKKTVDLAQTQIEGRRRAAQHMLQKFEGLAKDLPESSEPLRQLRNAPIESVLSLQHLRGGDEWSENQIQRYLAAVRQELQRLSASPASDISELHEIKGFFWLYQGELEPAIAEWTNAANLRPSDDDIKLRLAQLHSLLQIRKLKDRAKHEFSAGLSHFKAGQYKQAQARFKIADGLNPSNPDIQRHLQLTRQAMEFASKQEKIQDILSRAQQRSERGELWESVSHWADVLVLDPNNEEARDGLSKAGRRLNLSRSLRRVSAQAKREPKPETAAPVQERSDYSPERAREAYSLGVIYYTDNNLQAAKEAFSEALHYDPSLRKAKQGLDQVLAELDGHRK